MSEIKKFTAAIDLGTSKILGLVGTKKDGKLSILAEASRPTNSAIKRGIIHNVEEVAALINQVVKELEKKIDADICKIYVAIGGFSLRTIEDSIVRELGKMEMIEEKTISRLEEDICSVEREKGLDLIKAIRHEILVDGKVESKPEGVSCSKIEAIYKLLMIQSTVQEKLKMALSRIPNIKYQIEVGDLAIANAVLLDSEKQLGCALIDFGAGKTTVSIYKNNHLNHLWVFPMGGNVFNQDILKLNLLEEEVESFKRLYANVLPSDAELNEEIEIESKDGVRRVIKEFHTHIKSRAIEIVSNTVELIKSQEKDQNLSSGIIVTGGASRIKNLKELLQKNFQMPIRVASMYRSLDVPPNSVYNQPEYALAVGLLLMGHMDSGKPEKKEPAKIIFEPDPLPVKEEVPSSVQKKAKESKWTKFVSKVFGEEDDN